MTPTAIFPDPQVATQHQADLRAAAARARLTNRPFAIERHEARIPRRGIFRRAPVLVGF